MGHVLYTKRYYREPHWDGDDGNAAVTAEKS